MVHSIEERETTDYVCSVCGYVSDGILPDECPICGAKKERFVTFG
jgi:rubrerythrin